MRTPHTSRALIGAALVVALSAMGLPAQAHDEESLDNDAESGALAVEVRPSLVSVSDQVTIAAEYELDEDGDESEDDEPQDESGIADDEVTDDDVSTSDGTGTSTEAAPAAPAVTLTVDFGDGSQEEEMTTQADSDDDEIEATATHAYTADGAYTVTVTATPTTGTPTTVTVAVQVGGGVAQLAGDDRHDTAERISREDFPNDGDAGAILLARSDSFADALAASSVAVLEDAPVLLTTSADLPASVLEEIRRALGVTGTVYLLGGEAAIAPEVATALEALGYTVVRIAGEDRIATSLALAQFLVDAGVEVDEVVLASAANFPDALAAAAYAGSVEAPVLLTGTDGLDPRVADFLKTLGDVEVHVAGGPAAVSDAVLADLVALGLNGERLSGDDRYETAVELAEALYVGPTKVVLATGTNFPDALAGAALAGRDGAPVLLVGNTLPDSVREYLQDNAATITEVYVLGGDAAVPHAVLSEVRALLGL